MEDIQAEYKRLKELGVEFRSKPQDYGPSTAAILDDTNGNLIMIYQEKRTEELRFFTHGQFLNQGERAFLVIAGIQHFAGAKVFDDRGLGFGEVVLFAEILGKIKEEDLRWPVVGVTARFLDEQFPFLAPNTFQITARCVVQKLRAWGNGFVPFQRPDTSMPSILRSLGNGLPVMAAIVGSRSMVPVSSSQTVPAGIPGPRITYGTRWPPSKVVPLPSRNGPAEPPW